MKPVEKAAAPRKYRTYGRAKPDLLARLGSQCSYCEEGRSPQALDVEHIYPKDPHPELECEWDNFLISCETCNSYKNIHLGNGQQTALEQRFLWPHRDNTFRAFQYHSDGRVEVRPGLPRRTRDAAEGTRDMVGLMCNPAKAKDYAALGLAYEGTSKRKQHWSQAAAFRQMYLTRPTRSAAATIADAAAKMGYFSIWMEVFTDRHEVRRELIRAFKADPDCFDANTQPITKGRV